MATDDSNPWWPNRDQSLVHTVTELLHSGEYERLAELLDRVRLAREEQGDALSAQTLDLARRICLVCSQSQAEVEWHQQAGTEAAQREHKLRQQLDALLDLTGTREQLQGAPTPLEPVESISWRQRLQGLLRRRSVSRSPDHVTPSDPADTAHSLSQPPVRAQGRPGPLPGELEQEPGEALAAGIEVQEETGLPSLVVYSLGAFRVYQGEHLLTDWESLKAKCILKYLVAYHGTPIVKDVLMDLFWPDADPESARRSLHQAVYSLRRAFRYRQPDLPYVLFENDAYLLNPGMRIWIDFEEFEKHVRRGRRLEAAGEPSAAMEEYGIAEGLYEGDYLEEDPYEDWPQAKRQRLQAMYMETACCLSKYYFRQREHTAAITLCRKTLALDNCCEEAHRRLMRCYVAQGQRHLAVRQYQACAQALRQELDLVPSEQTAELYESIASSS